jgi:oligopeptide transport system permease protein
MQVGLVATAVALVIGVTWGSVAAFSGGRLGASMMRIVDVIYAMPFTILVILLMTVFERSFNLLFIAIGCTEWLTMARIVHGQVNSLKRQDFIEAAVALGLSRRAILVRHLLPNILGIIAVYTTLTVPTVILLESFLSFLGLGVRRRSRPGAPSSTTGRQHGEPPLPACHPRFLFSLTLFCMNFIGDGLRDALDPNPAATDPCPSSRSTTSPYPSTPARAWYAPSMA